MVLLKFLIHILNHLTMKKTSSCLNAAPSSFYRKLLGYNLLHFSVHLKKTADALFNSFLFEVNQTLDTTYLIYNHNTHVCYKEVPYYHQLIHTSLKCSNKIGYYGTTVINQINYRKMYMQMWLLFNLIHKLTFTAQIVNLWYELSIWTQYNKLENCKIHYD